MILHDPPGGASSASYKNTETTAVVIADTVTVGPSLSIEREVTKGADELVLDCVLPFPAGEGLCTQIEKSGDAKPIGINYNLDFSFEYKHTKTVTTTVSHAYEMETSTAQNYAGNSSDMYLVSVLAVLWMLDHYFL